MYAISFMHKPISEKREIIVSMESEEHVWEKFEPRTQASIYELNILMCRGPKLIPIVSDCMYKVAKRRSQTPQTGAKDFKYVSKLSGILLKIY